MSHDMIAELAAKAAANDDQTEVTKGGDFEYVPPAAGKTIGRFVEYIEIGKQKQRPYLGKPKPDADMVWLGFELLHPKKNIKEIEIEGEGKKTVADFIMVKAKKSQSEKASFKKIFNKMQYGRQDKKHLAQMLGEAFILDIYHNTDEATKKVYANLNTKEGEWGISAPFVIDPLTEERKDIPVRENIRPIRLFLWDFPNKETWDSLFIDGTRTMKVDGKDVEVSKNYIQEKIKGATNFEGSALHQMLSEVPELKVTKDKGHAEEALDSLGSGTVEVDDLAALGL